ncbi:Nucleotide-binding universal stress protein, UspA family [Paenibacillus sp. 1_12]|uniref:universal stress protein n=1 Tax=Paenibacillus sp. 1_12 TaxID=1566278 RepID=UPI0008E50026|nr:universal stress protein [Paenibacillus sp. 1_12]SFL14161.1 Nucleotide-binding universal stress protein, UspA family [Paenibacillus sp. 1_12]
MFNKILVAYDGSETAKIALNKAIELKQIFVESELVVAHVFQVSNLVLNDAVITGPAVIQTELYQAAEELIDEVKQLISNLSKTSATLLDGGAPARVILDYAEAHHFDLIIVGSRGFGTFKEILLGSVSSEIVHHAQIPVLVVK